MRSFGDFLPSSNLLSKTKEWKKNSILYTVQWLSVCKRIAANLNGAELRMVWLIIWYTGGPQNKLSSHGVLEFFQRITIRIISEGECPSLELMDMELFDTAF